MCPIQGAFWEKSAHDSTNHFRQGKHTFFRARARLHPCDSTPVPSIRIRPDPVKNSTVCGKISFLCGSIPGTFWARKIKRTAQGCCCLKR